MSATDRKQTLTELNPRAWLSDRLRNKADIQTYIKRMVVGAGQIR